MKGTLLDVIFVDFKRESQRAMAACKVFDHVIHQNGYLSREMAFH